MRLAYPHLTEMWEMGPTAAPYDMMHLILLNVVPHMWRLFAGLKLVNKHNDEAYIIPKSTVALMGRERRASRPTVPLAQARSLRNIDVHHKSFKAVDWLHFVLCTGEVLLSGRIPGEFYDSFMALCRDCRLVFRPRGVSETEIMAIDKDIKYFVTNYYPKIYRESIERLPLCLSTFATLLDVFPLLRACGPAWFFWQFPMERKNGALGKLIRPHSKPHGSLEENLTRQCNSELRSNFGETYLSTEWTTTTGKPLTALGLPRGNFVVVQTIGPDCALLPPTFADAILCRDELMRMRAVLDREQAIQVPLIIRAKKYSRAKLASGTIAGSKKVGSDCDKHRPRNYLVRIDSAEQFELPDGSIGQRPVSTFGAVIHYAFAFIHGQPMALAFVERAMSAKERRGRFGCAASKYGVECLLGLGGLRYYVPFGAVGEVVGTMEREGVHSVLFTREPFSES